MSSAHTRRRETRAAWLMLAPTLLVIGLVVGVPLVLVVFISLTNYGRRSLFTGEYDWVGISQYTSMLTDPAFWASLSRTLWFTAALVVGSILIGTALSHLLTRLGPIMRSAVSAALVLAWAMPTVASSLVWKFLFQPGYGVANWALTQLGIFGDMQQADWSNNTWLAFTCIWILIVWQAVPFIALTLYAAQTQVPSELLESAEMDGANEWRRWWSIILPALRPTLLLVTILSIIWDFTVFNQIWLVSSGGPDDTTATLGVYAYKTAFVGFELGHGAAISLTTTVLLLIISSVYVRQLIKAGDDL